ncbi:MAG TPA: FAD-binding oxidoreductase [Thermoanaerobaculaceae bacterium]|nr:FAD-binding oxidoreductase [Thermoanaerobaculaceae bacterium]
MAVARRPGAAADAVLDAVPPVVFEPASTAEAAEALRECAGEKRAVVFVGGGTELGVGAPPRGLGAVLRTGALSRVVEYAPADQIVTVEAGITLAALQGSLRGHHQRLALDPPRAGEATVGGIVAANSFGPLRTRYGTSRDLIVGVTLVRADGVVARGGGKVVKNVAGFDLPRLMVGSLGTLGLIATATFRLHPLPDESATLLLPGLAAAAVRRLAARLREAQLEPAAVAVVGINPFDAAVRFEGFTASVKAQSERLAAIAGELGAACDRLAPAPAASWWERHDAARSRGAVRLKLAALPSQFETVAREAIGAVATAAAGSEYVGYPTLGLGFVSAPAAGNGLAAAIGAARAALERLGGSLAVHAAPPELRAALDPWGAAPPALALMRSLKAQLDPEARLAPGRQAGGI